MLLFFNAQLAYLAMTKTGSTTIEAALGPHSDFAFRKLPFKHTDLRQYRAGSIPFLDAYGKHDARTFETVCIIREPLDYLESWYRFRSRDVARARIAEDMSFPDFVAAVLSDDPPRAARIRRPSTFVTDGAARVDTLLRYGDPGIADFFAHRLGVFVPFERRNVSPRREIVPLPKDLRARLETEWAEEFALFHDAARPVDLPAWPRPSPFSHGLTRVRNVARRIIR